VTHELHPEPPAHDPPSKVEPIGHITKEEVTRAVKSMGLSKSPGPSGLGPAHWRVMIQVPGMPETLNEILGSAQRREHRDLYAFRFALIPKDGVAGKHRPVAIGETITMAFHKILLSRLKAQVTGYLEHEQIAFRRNAHAVGVRMAFNSMQKEGTQAVALDMQNAFNSIPKEEILHGLDEAHVPLVLRNYTEARSAPRLGPLRRPAEHDAYCLGQNALLRQLKLIAYADDVLIFHENISVDAADIIGEASDLAKRFGLTVNVDKCKDRK
ncbi:Reverse transcriptase, partial [Giardia duodenalis]